jgi:uncharacterized membrane protein (UPF0127 family)
VTSLIKTATNEILIKKLLIRTSFPGRLRGLLFRPGLDKDTAMLLLGTRRVHTFGMLFPLDLYFFSASMNLIDKRFNVKPWGIPVSPLETHHILEVHHCPLSEGLQIKAGDQISIFWRVAS